MDNKLEFSGNTYEDARSKAYAHFKCEPWMLELTQLEEGSETLYAEYISLDKMVEHDRENPRELKPIPANTKDGRIPTRFACAYRDDGVYLVLKDEIYPPKEIVEGFIKLKRIESVDKAALEKALAETLKEIKIAGHQEEKLISPGIDVFKADDDMEAFIEFFPGEPGGEATDLAHIAKNLQAAGVVKGIDINTLYKMYYGRTFNNRLTIAKGMPPKNGEDAEITFNFQTVRERSPKILDDGTVDYKDLGFIENVRAGDVLAVMKPETKGLDGYTVSGKPIKAKDGKRLNLPKGKNTDISEDKLHLVAACDGSVDLVDGRVVVSNTLEIRGDVDASTGNIDFIGDILVRGNVKSGYTIKGTGNIEVQGTVEAATIIADGNINLCQGIFGMNTGMVQAGGNIIALFIQNAKVSAKGSIMTDTILHSNVSSGEIILVKGKKGLITGGRATAAVSIAAERSASSNSSTITILEVGIPPELRNRIQELEKTISGHETNLLRIEPLAEKFQQLELLGRLSTEQSIQKVRTLGLLSRLKSEIASMKAEQEEIKEMIKVSNEGSIHIRENAYAFTTIIIGTVKLMLKDEYKYTTFKVVGGEIVALPYSFSGGGISSKDVKFHKGG